ncbi:MAG: proprotein convertase P-domain-containing protein [Acidobacteria bacterium]|nr:proprotein convertase P-domain-containing protein [Acidobacteriota bacterium]
MRKMLLGVSLMICLVLSTSFLVSSNSSFSVPPKPAPQRQTDEALRPLYENKDTFNQLSGAARSRLEMIFGKKDPKKEAEEAENGGTKTLTNGAGKKTRTNNDVPSLSYSAGNTIQPLAAPVTLSVNNPAADATARNTQSETSIALAANGNVIVSWNDSGSLQNPSFTTPNDKFTGVGVSTNGGTSFTDLGTFPSTALTGAQGDAGDPLIAVDRTSGRVYVATLAFTNSGIQIFRSTDNGLTYTQPTNAFPGFQNADFFDKEWIAVDNATGTGQGNVYVVSRLFSGSSNVSGIYFSRSTDQGNTFSVPVGTPNIVTGQQGAYVTVGPDHSVYVFWYDSSAGRRIRMRKSTDLGVTFGPTINVSPLLNSAGVNGDLALTGGFRSNSFPQAVVSQANGNFLYTTYNDINVGGTDRGDVFVVGSTDGGSTWGTPVKINDDATLTQQYGPVIAITPDGTKLFSGFYDRRRTSNAGIDVFGAIQTINTTTGALTALGGNFRITEQSFPVVVGVDPVINSTYMGDYDQAVADNSFFYLTWGDNRTGNPDVRFSKISTAGPGALLDFSAVTIVADGDSNGKIDINESVSLNVTLRNNGTSTASGVTATLATTTPGVTVVTPNASYPNIAAGMTATNNTPFVIMTAPNFVCGTNIQFTLTVNTASDGSFMVPFSVGSGTVGAPMSFESVNVPVNILDVATVTSTTNVSGLTGSVGKVTVSFFLTHTFDADLDIFLIGPDGTTVELTTDNGGASDNYGTSCANRTVFDDAAATPITSGVAPFVGTFRPEGMLSAFNGKPGNGTWTLRITDDLGGDVGVLMCWGLQISPLTCNGGNAPQLDRANVIVADTSNSRLQATTNNGSTWAVVGTQRFNNPQAVATNNMGNLIFVAETGSSRILRSTDAGTTFTPIIFAGLAPGTVNAPAGLAYDQANDKLYVADTGNNRIQVLNTASTATTGMTIFAGSSAGATVGQFNQPTGIAVNASGIVYVCDTANNRIQFNPSGATGGWRIFAGATAGNTLGKVNGPRGIYVNAAGLVFVADTLNNRIMTNMGGSDTLTGTWMQLINAGAAIGTVNAPQGVVFTSGSFVFVSDSNRIQRFTSTGGSPFLSGGAGVAVGQFNGPRGIR